MQDGHTWCNSVEEDGVGARAVIVAKGHREAIVCWHVPKTGQLCGHRRHWKPKGVRLQHRGAALHTMWGSDLNKWQQNQQQLCEITWVTAIMGKAFGQLMGVSSW